MTKNIGNIDKIVRLVIGVLFIGFGLLSNSWLGAIGIIPIVTALIGWCPLYPIFKISTCDKSSLE